MGDLSTCPLGGAHYQERGVWSGVCVWLSEITGSLANLSHIQHCASLLVYLRSWWTRIRHMLRALWLSTVMHVQRLQGSFPCLASKVSDILTLTLVDVTPRSVTDIGV